jgi:signal transduction histidine kinase/CheY-like chemotaxis protein
VVLAIDNGKSVREQAQGGDVEGNASRLAPGAGWAGLCESEHFVQFYEADAFLLDSLGGFIGDGLCAGDACIVVATKEHLYGLEERLRARGSEVDAANATGQFISLDAREVLPSLLVDGTPEPRRFADVIGSVVERAAQARGRVRIFGELVALLWAEGNHDAALRLEELWNGLREIHSFSLFCGYPMSGFGGETQAALLSGVCATHSRVIPAESYTALSDPEERLRAIALLQQKARTLEAEIAERKEVEASLLALKERLEVQVIREQVARAEAESANRLKDEFLATVSHELRTPLTAILGWSHMLRGGRLDENTAARALDAIERNAQSQAQLVEDILDVSRVITGKLRLSVAPVDLSSVINAAIDSVQLAADSKGIRLEVTLDPSARHATGDASRLQQIVWNLLSNAIKFTDAGGRVGVRLERSGSFAQVRVSDTGHGISPDFLPFIFDRFRQADGSITRTHGGLGLGLAIVRNLVELHGGTVKAESAGEGFGATFIITLPLANARTSARSRRHKINLGQAAGEVAAHNTLPPLEGVRVLLVDDDPDTLNVLAVVLTEQSAEVQTASSVAEALEVFRWYAPDVVVSDLAMPGEDGFSLIGKLRELEVEDSRLTPALALTAHARVDDRVRALSVGFNMFVPKPVEPDELITAIAHLVETDSADVPTA